MSQVERLGANLRRVDVVQHDVPGNPPDQAGVGERGTHRPSADDRYLIDPTNTHLCLPSKQRCHRSVAEDGVDGPRDERGD